MDQKVMYWMSESKENLDTAKVLYRNGKLLETAFFCHLATEKMLKAFIAKRKETIPPKIHNLLSLANKGSLDNELSESQFNFFADLNPFQLEGRYPGDREILLKKTAKREFEELLKRTEAELKWLEQKLKSEK
ncbi:HEPN domain-containing protein [Salicibibacter cibarius]|uniref:HEPN domain-containing protein n=1 Tax=Salicibibacter cibarius TaxID=2743000 RepID=A0A7T7CC62_9BACI|nr:HEPN domain-containing protein [Salicibibacter cibarius]QQK76608.1 HEPN domain-containing protein [Salicibibacter cibarius]